ncbi:hypothetical protein [Leucobacter sp. M11]|uniref:hypothetical protein n=1 Tax=Leucobacter sp. M11 TaxID=2993565 RepID=UPI002D7FED78|nr:hypothetical protein [Leucobacter sp. M11]MEB4614342.1 hypothetical protein [Leucobacter sp. M11]
MAGQVTEREDDITVHAGPRATQPQGEPTPGEPIPREPIPGGALLLNYAALGAGALALRAGGTAGVGSPRPRTGESGSPVVDEAVAELDRARRSAEEALRAESARGAAQAEEAVRAFRALDARAAR